MPRFNPLASVSKFTAGMTLWVVPHAGYSKPLSADELKFRRLTVVSAARRWIETRDDAGFTFFVDATTGFFSMMKSNVPFNSMNEKAIVYPSLVAYRQDRACGAVHDGILKSLASTLAARDHKRLVSLARQLGVQVDDIPSEEELIAAVTK